MCREREWIVLHEVAVAGPLAPGCCPSQALTDLQDREALPGPIGSLSQ